MIEYELFKDSHQKFKSYLDDDEVKNILFSGRFGIGKTTFIRDFFNKEEDYEAIHLFPVNYSVLSNQDIFEYIKYDILFELLLKLESRETTDNTLSILQALPVYAQYNFFRFLPVLVLLVPKMGKQIFQLFQELEKYKEDFLEIKERAESSDIKDAISFLSSFDDLKGGIYEDNSITKIIQRILESIFVDKKKVLVIDDMDRIDPNHLFRILNILSVHNDHLNEDKEDKFGFNKIVLVCDSKNVHNIFSNKYGQNVDFNGYIDKFYDKEIFYFDNKNSILNFINEIIKSVSFTGSTDGHTNLLNNQYSHLKSILTIVFTDLVFYDIINLRVLFKYYKKTIELPFVNVEYDSIDRIVDWQLSIILIFKIIKKHLGSDSQVISTFDKLSKKDNRFGRLYNTSIGEAVLLLQIRDHMMKSPIGGEEFNVYNDTETSTIIHYKFKAEYLGNAMFYYIKQIDFLEDIDHGEMAKKSKNLPSVYSIWIKAYKMLVEIIDL